MGRSCGLSSEGRPADPPGVTPRCPAVAPYSMMRSVVGAWVRRTGRGLGFLPNGIIHRCLGPNPEHQLDVLRSSFPQCKDPCPQDGNARNRRAKAVGPTNAVH